jgi:dTDP-D-glucose 4,6-dehydratase
MILVTGRTGFGGTNFVLDCLAQSEKAAINSPQSLCARKHKNRISQVTADEKRHFFVQGSRLVQNGLCHLHIKFSTPSKASARGGY